MNYIQFKRKALTDIAYRIYLIGITFEYSVNDNYVFLAYDGVSTLCVFESGVNVSVSPVNAQGVPTVIDLSDVPQMALDIQNKQGVSFGISFVTDDMEVLAEILNSVAFSINADELVNDSVSANVLQGVIAQINFETQNTLQNKVEIKTGVPFSVDATSLVNQEIFAQALYRYFVIIDLSSPTLQGIEASVKDAVTFSITASGVTLSTTVSMSDSVPYSITAEGLENTAVDLGSKTGVPAEMSLSDVVDDSLGVDINDGVPFNIVLLNIPIMSVDSAVLGSVSLSLSFTTINLSSKVESKQGRPLSLAINGVTSIIVLLEPLNGGSIQIATAEVINHEVTVQLARHALLSDYSSKTLAEMGTKTLFELKYII